MQKLIKISLIIIISLYLGFGIYYIVISKSRSILDSKEYIEKIDSLESEISIFQFKKDSIDTVIDTVYIKIKDNNKRYEKNINNIINNSTNDDYLFFTKYIERNKTRFDSIYNF